MRRKNTTRGFTLLEVLIAVLIVGIIAAAAVPLLGSYTEKAREAREEANLQIKARAIERYALDHKVPLGMIYDPSDNTVMTYGLETMQGPTAQLLLPTDVNGNVMDDPMTASPGPYIYGPYLAQLPPEPAALLAATAVKPSIMAFSEEPIFLQLLARDGGLYVQAAKGNGKTDSDFFNSSGKLARRAFPSLAWHDPEFRIDFPAAIRRNRITKDEEKEIALTVLRTILLSVPAASKKAIDLNNVLKKIETQAAWERESGIIEGVKEAQRFYIERFPELINAEIAVDDMLAELGTRPNPGSLQELTAAKMLMPNLIEYQVISKHRVNSLADPDAYPLEVRNTIRAREMAVGETYGANVDVWYQALGFKTRPDLKSFHDRLEQVGSKYVDMRVVQVYGDQLVEVGEEMGNVSLRVGEVTSNLNYGTLSAQEGRIKELDINDLKRTVKRTGHPELTKQIATAKSVAVGMDYDSYATGRAIEEGVDPKHWVEFVSNGLRDATKKLGEPKDMRGIVMFIVPAKIPMKYWTGVKGAGVRIDRPDKILERLKVYLESSLNNLNL